MLLGVIYGGRGDAPEATEGNRIMFDEQRVEDLRWATVRAEELADRLLELRREAERLEWALGDLNDFDMISFWQLDYSLGNAFDNVEDIRIRVTRELVTAEAVLEAQTA